MLQKYAARVSYVGTRYCGWQRQKEASGELPSIQSALGQALQTITGEEVSLVGSGRTDSGVHALGQVAHFTLKQKIWDARALFNGVNSLLAPEHKDIRVLAVVPVEPDFHAQRSARKKQYSYYFQQGACALPHLEPYSFWIRKKLDLDAMNAALTHLRGEHDFKPFRASGAAPGTTVRKIFEAEAVLEPIAFQGRVGSLEFGLVRVRFVGSGFLKQMIRGIAGTLLQVGEGRRDPACIREILASGDRSAIGPTAVGRALWLERVWYPEHFGVD